MDFIPFVRTVSWGKLANLGGTLASAELGALLHQDHHLFGREVRRRFPELIALGRHVQHELEGPTGLCILDDLRGLAVAPQLMAAAFVALCHQVGTPTGHDDKNQVVWHVKDRPVEGGRERTFSERTGEAPFHTDSAFAERPEEYFALYMIRPALCGGGLSRIITLAKLEEALEGSAEGRWCREVLQRDYYPFKTPAAFSASGQVQYGRIFANGILRYRFDALQAGMKVVPDGVTAEMRDALAWFDRLVESEIAPIEFGLGAGQAVFVNNQRVLHARSPYTDNQRHLIRVRMQRQSWHHPVETASCLPS